MRYYIVDRNNLKEVTDIEYDEWMLHESKNYTLPEFSTTINGNFYGLETMFFGCIDKGEEVLPFVLLYFEDIPIIKEDKLDVEMEANTVEYFGTFGEMKKRYDELIGEIKVKELLQ